VLSVVEGTGQLFGAVHIVDILYGGNTEKIRKFDHDQLEGYGAGKPFGKDELRSIIRQLVASGFLNLDAAGHGGLNISEKGFKLARGNAEFNYRQEEAYFPAEREKRDRKPLSTGLSEADEGLYNMLKGRRLALAQERGVPAYVVFTDKTLVDMAYRKPRSIVEFLNVNGVGKSKTDKFSKPFLQVISDYLIG